MAFPIQRPRRLRRSPLLRKMVRETALAPDDLILPLFVLENAPAGTTTPIKAMPGCAQQSPDMAAKSAQEAFQAGVPAVILFGLPARKDATGSGAWAADGAVQVAAREIKSKVPEMIVICDTCLCEYTDHGHCGIIKNDTVDNDPTLELLARTAVSQAAAGADMVAPSDMMDGRVAAMRRALDQEGFLDTAIMSYAAKFASAYYGPFREAAECAPSFGDRKTYQMDAANRREALKETALDIEEGADIIMVKPALPYLDVIRDLHAQFPLPLAAYQVSGEYAQIKCAARAGLVDESAIMLESLLCIKRAGAKMILTYFALDAARLLTL